ncbi:hypothetical protein Q3G72_033646 [Acer saccharum]|nr:hypothetical protein Q3G72_033646 [Acer saccharum]
MTIAFCQVAENLMVLNLLGRWNLAAVPDLSEHPIRASDPRKALIAIPGSVGNLRSLTEFLIDGAAVNELPHTISQLSYLKAFSVSNCRFLSK